MKTRKELVDEFNDEGYTAGYQQAKKDVLKLIDEWKKEYGLEDYEIEQLIARIEG